MDQTAHDLFLRGRARQTAPAPDPTLNSESAALLEQAIDRDPGYAAAWAHLARTLAKRLRYGDPSLPYADLRARVTEAAETALRLDPGSGVAYLALADLEAFGDYARREALVAKALAAAPHDPVVLALVGSFAAEVGRVGEALAHADHAFDLDPRLFWTAYSLAAFRDFAGDSSSLPLWETCCDLWPDSEMVFSATWAAALHGDWPRFEALGARARRLTGEAQQVRLRAYRWLGRYLRAEEARSLEPVLEVCRRDLQRIGTVDPDWLMILCRLGLAEEAFDIVDQASFSHMFDPEQRWPTQPVTGGGIFSLSHNGPMIADPRFPRLCAKLGHCAYWLETDRWPDCAEAVDYDFKGECRRLAA